MQQRIALPGHIVVEVHIADLNLWHFDFPSGPRRRPSTLFVSAESPLLHIVDGIAGQRGIRGRIGPIDRSVLRIVVAHQLDILARGNLKFVRVGKIGRSVGRRRRWLCRWWRRRSSDDLAHLDRVDLATAGRGRRQLHAWNIGHARRWRLAARARRDADRGGSQQRHSGGKFRPVMSRDHRDSVHAAVEADAATSIPARAARSTLRHLRISSLPAT